MDQIKTELSPYPPYFGPYSISPNRFRGYKPSYPNTHSNSPSCIPPRPAKQPLELSYWELISPALFGTGAALFLSLFSSKKNSEPIEPFGGALFKFALVGYSFGALVSVYFAIKKAVLDSLPSYQNLFRPVAGALISVILLFSSEYLLLYKFFPSSFEGDVGDDFCTQLFSFVYLSSTTIATAGLGDIKPVDVTARALIALEITFYLFALATALPLLLIQKLD